MVHQELNENNLINQDARRATSARFRLTCARMLLAKKEQRRKMMLAH